MDKSDKKRPFRERYSEFRKRFGTEEKCRDYIFQRRWPDGFKCPSCGHTEYSLHKTRPLYECKNKECKKQTSITAGTFFDKTRTSLKTWFRMIFLVTIRKKISTRELQKKLKMGSYGTARKNREKIERILEGIMPTREGIKDPQRIADYKKLMGIVDGRDVTGWAARNWKRFEGRSTAPPSRKNPPSSTPAQPSPAHTQKPPAPLPPDKPAA